MKISNEFSWKTTAIVTAAAATTAVVAGLAMKTFSNSVQKKVPQKWIKVGTVKELTIYPIKSCRGIAISEGIVTKLGLIGIGSELLRDRVFMVVDKNGIFQIQREYPKLAVIEFSAVNFEITLKAPEMADYSFELPAYSPDKDIKCQMFLEENLNGMDCGDGVGKWINNFLKTNDFRLVYHRGKTTQRQLSDNQKKFPLTSPHDVGTFQNYTSYLLIGEESVHDLNRHLKKPVTFKNFRPTILISNILEPFSEIKWGFVQIGHALFKASKPCERCSIVTVDQTTGIKDPAGDPLKTLMKMKPEFDDDLVKDLLKNRGIMGLQLGLDESSQENVIIKVGDPVLVALL